MFIFVENGKQQEEKREEKKPAIVTEFTNVHSTLMLLPLPPFSRLYHLVRCAKHFRLMICNSCSVISYLGFSWVFPRKMAHCVAFECGNQAKTKQDPKRRFFCFQKDNSLRRAWIHAVGKTSPPKIPVCVRIIAEAIATINHA